jgi:hypothetical protein
VIVLPTRFNPVGNVFDVEYTTALPSGSVAVNVTAFEPVAASFIYIVMLPAAAGTLQTGVPLII